MVMITDVLPNFKPLLSGKLNWNKLCYPVLISPKFDGIRALSYRGKLFSRTLKLIPNRHIQEIALNFPSRFDGELIVGSPTDKNCMRNTASGVMSFDGKPDFTYYVFDSFGYPERSFADRLNNLLEWELKQKSLHIKVVKHHICYKREDVEAYIAEYVNLGYEGIMLRNLLGGYKFGQSTTNEGILLKYKVFETEWAKVIGFEELMHNENEAEIDNLGHQKRGHSNAGKVQSGMLGALIVKSPMWDKPFNIGTGFDQKERISIWAKTDEILGKTVEFSYQPHGTLDVPRTPVFKSFREDM